MGRDFFLISPPQEIPILSVRRRGRGEVWIFSATAQFYNYFGNRPI